MMKKVKSCMLIPVIMVIIVICCMACSKDTTNISSGSNNDDPSFNFTADFYDNYGKCWFSVGGKKFSIKPNKVKEYYYSSNGTWTSGWTTSSIMTISIDNHQIDSCGSTVIFADNRLERIDWDSLESAEPTESGPETITSPSNIRFDDYLKIKWWWTTTQISKKSQGTSRLLVILSQEGSPICMYLGNDVNWDIPRNLPKTTKVSIDGKDVYIHRTTFALIDTDLLKTNEEGLK